MGISLDVTDNADDCEQLSNRYSEAVEIVRKLSNPITQKPCTQNQHGIPVL